MQLVLKELVLRILRLPPTLLCYDVVLLVWYIHTTYTHVVEEQRPEELHDTGVLHHLYVLWSCRGFGYRLNKCHTRPLVSLEVLKDRHAAHDRASLLERIEREGIFFQICRNEFISRESGNCKPQPPLIFEEALWRREQLVKLFLRRVFYPERVLREEFRGLIPVFAGRIEEL